MRAVGEEAGREGSAHSSLVRKVVEEGSSWKMPGPSFPYPMLSERRLLPGKTQCPSRPWSPPTPVPAASGSPPAPHISCVLAALAARLSDSGCLQALFPWLECCSLGPLPG